MASTKRPPAISGVSSEKEAVIMTVYPSIASAAPGKWLGNLYDSIPIKVGGIKLSHLLFVLPTAPLALAGYAQLKVLGEVYVLTNRSMQKRASLGNRLLTQVSLANIADVTLVQEPGQAFYPAADLYLVDKKGDTQMVLAGVPRAEIFRQIILDAVTARKQVEESLSRIKARKPVTA